MANEGRGFKVPAGSPGVPAVEISDDAREQSMFIVAAIMAGATPEQIMVFQAKGWSEDVTDLLARPCEPEEISAHVDLLAAALAA